MSAMHFRVGIIAIIVLAGGYLLTKKSAEIGSDTNTILARLEDAKDIPVGAPITVAGLQIGTVVGHRVGAGFAELAIEFDSSVDLRADATLYKRRISFLSGPSLELDPGTSEDPLPGNYIRRVAETPPIGDVLYDVHEALPAVGDLAIEGLNISESFRAHVRGPVASRVEEFDQAAERIQGQVHDRLQAMNEGLKRSENVELDVKAAVNPVFNRSEELSERARADLGEAKTWVHASAERARQRIDDTQLDWNKYSTPVREIDEGEGQVGELLNSGEGYDDWVEITGGARDLFRTLTKWKSQVGLRAEVGVTSGQTRIYVTLHIGRYDRFYYLELVIPPQGGVPTIAAEYDPSIDNWRRSFSVVGGALRFTGQFAGRWGPAVFRYGLKESTFGAGVDYELIDNRLQLSADVFEFGRQDNPRLKVAASYRVFSQLYVNAGLDDIFNPGRNFDIAPLGTDNPRILDSVYIGRELYFGASLQFTDHDLLALLRIGGDVILSLAPSR